MLGGSVGLAAGGGLGYAIELERRRRNQAENDAYYESRKIEEML